MTQVAGRKTPKAVWHQFDLPQWVDYIQHQHWRSIEMTLDRVARVWHRLDDGTGCYTISVAGTNGKGSTVGFLEQALVRSGLRAGAYTSPHLVRFNERVRIDGVAVSDAEICRALCRVEEAAGHTPLTYFEYATLCALCLFQRNRVQVRVLEVGMGGRLDAVNIIDADVSVITAIGLDHQAWLGADRESIALEKAGIIRSKRPVVCSDPDMPNSLSAAAAEKQAPLVAVDRDFFLEETSDGHVWHGENTLFSGDWKTVPAVQVPFPGQHQKFNLAGALAVLSILAKSLRLDKKRVVRGIAGASIDARCQIVSRSPLTILDVAHNDDSVRMLAQFLDQHPVCGTSIAVFGGLRDKALAHFADLLGRRIDRWMLAGLEAGDRGQTARELAEKISPVVEDQYLECFDDPLAAYSKAVQQAGHDDRIIVFGSFITVGAILPHINERTES